MNDLTEFVTISDTTLVTDSRRVAKHFKKRHDNVLRTFDAMKCSPEYRLLNYVETVETRANPSGGAPISSRVIRMTKNGFVMFVMGFTGEEAMKMKETYINAFDAMADQLTRISQGLWQQMMDLERRDASSFSLASFGAKRMVERKNELTALENERALLDSKIQPMLFPGCLLVTH